MSTFWWAGAGSDGGVMINGGDGGAAQGENGDADITDMSAYGGGGGSQSQGGTGGYFPSYSAGGQGSLGMGGNPTGCGGGGGAGYYGGGGGSWTAGGGGSNWASGTISTNSRGVNSGNGKVIIALTSAAEVKTSNLRGAANK